MLLTSHNMQDCPHNEEDPAPKGQECHVEKSQSKDSMLVVFFTVYPGRMFH